MSASEPDRLSLATKIVYLYIIYWVLCFLCLLSNVPLVLLQMPLLRGQVIIHSSLFQWFIWKLVVAFSGRQEFGGMSPYTQTHTKKRRMLGWSMQPTHSLGSQGPRSRHWHSAGLLKPRSPNFRAWLLIRRDFSSMAMPDLAPVLPLELSHWLALSLLSKDAATVTV